MTYQFAFAVLGEPTAGDTIVWDGINRTWVVGAPTDGYSITSYGASESSADNTSAIQGLIDIVPEGSTIVVPNGRFLTDPLTINKRLHWKGPGTLVQRAPYTGAGGLLTFTSLAAGSSVDNLEFDGNWDNVVGGWGGTGDIWCAILALNVDDFKVSRLTIHDFIGFGHWFQGSRMSVSDVTVRQCAKGSQLKRCYDSQFQGLRYYDIGNRGLALFQHCLEWRDMSDCVFTEILVKDFSPDSLALEPTPGGLTLERCKRLQFSGVQIVGWLGTSSSGRSRAIAIDTCESIIGDFTTFGYSTSLGAFSCTNCEIFPAFDGNYSENVSTGVEITHSGILESSTGALSTNARSVYASRGVVLLGGYVTRHSDGLQIRGQASGCIGTEIVGNNTSGVVFAEADTLTLFANYQAQLPTDCFLRNCLIHCNGRQGVQLDEWRRIDLSDTIITNNGQDATGAENQRSGLACLTGSGTREILSFNSCTFTDTQGWTKTLACSFEPGATDTNDQKIVYLLDPQDISVGQFITLANAAGPGDILGRVVNVFREAFTIEVAGGATFGATGNLVALSGTISSSGQTVTGIGTAFLTEVTGRAFIFADGEYRQVRLVNSNTQLIVEEGWTAPLSGDTAEILLVDVEGVPSQSQGVRLPAGIGPIRALDNFYNGNVVRSMSLADINVFDWGSEVVLSNNAPGANLNTGGVTTTLIGGLPAGWVTIGARMQITNEVTDTDGTLNLEFRDGGGSVYVMASTGTYTVGESIRGDTDRAVLGASPSLNIRITGGGDNIPSAGTVYAECTLKSPAMPLFN